MSEQIETGADGAALSLMDVISDDVDLLESLSSRERLGQVRKAVARLPPQEKQVIFLRYGLDGNPPRRQREVAQGLGISRSYVSRIEKRALGMLRKYMEE